MEYEYFQKGNKSSLPFQPALTSHFNYLSGSNLTDALFNKSSALQRQGDIITFSTLFILLHCRPIGIVALFLFYLAKFLLSISMDTFPNAVLYFSKNVFTKWWKYLSEEGCCGTLSHCICIKKNSKIAVLSFLSSVSRAFIYFIPLMGANNR